MNMAAHPMPCGIKPFEAKPLLEFVFLGRGGQGVVTASRILAEAFLLEGRHVQSLPEFGPERSGSPVRAFARVSTQPIFSRSPVRVADVAVVFDPLLLVDVPSPIKEGGVLVLNLERSSRCESFKNCEVFSVDARSIAMKHGRPRSLNIAMLGAVAAAGLADRSLLERVVRAKFDDQDASALREACMEARRVDH